MVSGLSRVPLLCSSWPGARENHTLKGLRQLSTHLIWCTMGLGKQWHSKAQSEPYSKTGLTAEPLLFEHRVEGGEQHLPALGRKAWWWPSSCLCQVRYTQFISESASGPGRLAITASNIYLAFLPRAGRTTADRLSVISLMPSQSFSQGILLYEVFAYHAYLQFFSHHQTNKMSTDIASQFLTNTFSSHSHGLPFSNFPL